MGLYFLKPLFIHIHFPANKIINWVKFDPYLEGKYNVPVAVTRFSISLMIYSSLLLYGNSYLIILSVVLNLHVSDFFRCLARALGVSTFHYPPPLSFEILSICPSLFDIMYKFKSSPNFDRNYEETLLI